MPYTATGDRPDAAGIPAVTCVPAAVTSVPAVTGFPAVTRVLSLAVCGMLDDVVGMHFCLHGFFANTNISAVAGVQIRFLSSPIALWYNGCLNISIHTERANFNILFIKLLLEHIL